MKSQISGLAGLVGLSAVFFACLAIGRIAAKRGVLSAEAYSAQQALLGRFGLPDHVDGVAAADLLGPLSRDKKARGSTIQWVLATGIGSVTTARDVTADEVAVALREVGCS